MEICGVKEEQLPKLYESWQVVGTLKKSIADELGFSENVKVVAVSYTHLQEECTLEFLDRLIRRHLEEIPFENLDLVRTHELISTDLDTVYKKIIQGKRGGYCFELNALFLGLPVSYTHLDVYKRQVNTVLHI